MVWVYRPANHHTEGEWVGRSGTKVSKRREKRLWEEGLQG